MEVFGRMVGKMSARLVGGFIGFPMLWVNFNSVFLRNILRKFTQPNKTLSCFLISNLKCDLG